MTKGKPYLPQPGTEMLLRPTAGDARNPNRSGYQTDNASNAMRFDVDPLGYPIVIRHSGINQISQTFPEARRLRAGCRVVLGEANPRTFLSDYAKGRFNKMTSSVAGLAKGVSPAGISTRSSPTWRRSALAGSIRMNHFLAR